jgi:hypothetical protein
MYKKHSTAILQFSLKKIRDSQFWKNSSPTEKIFDQEKTLTVI